MLVLMKCERSVFQTATVFILCAKQPQCFVVVKRTFDQTSVVLGRSSVHIFVSRVARIKPIINIFRQTISYNVFLTSKII